MAVPTVGQGNKAICALKKESTYGTAVDADTVVPFLSEDFERIIDQIEGEAMQGAVSATNVRTGVQSVSGSISMEAVYDTISGDIKGVDSFLLGALGAAAYATNYNKFTANDDLDPSFTIAFDKRVDVWEVAGAKVNTLQITGSAGAGGKVTMTAGLVCQQLRMTGDSGISNTTSELRALNPTAEPALISYSDVTIRMDTVASGSLSSSDQKNISSFTLDINNNLAVDHHATPLAAETAGLILEPVRNGMREVTLTLTFPRYDSASNTIIKYLSAGTAVQCEIKMSNGSNEFNIYLPNCYLHNPTNAPIGGPEVYPVTVTLKAYRNNGTNTNMTFTNAQAITEEIAIETKNARTTTP